MKLASILFLAAVSAPFTFASSAQAVLLWGLDPSSQSANGVDPSNATVTQTLAPNVLGTDGTGYGNSQVGLSTTFDTAASGGGNIYIRHANAAGSTTLNYATGYTEFTISAAPGFELNLDDLSFLSGRGGTSGTRGFEIYGAVEATPTIADLLLDIDAETGTRGSPVARSIDLTAAQYQGIDSITFRYYPLTTGTGLSIEWSDMRLNGTVTAVVAPVVVPEPSSLALAGLGLIALCRGRRQTR